MGSEQFSTAVRGSGGDPVSVSQTGAFETDNYAEGDAWSDDGTGYPKTINPAETINEFGITRPANIEIEISTTSGTTFQMELADRTLVLDHLKIDKIVLKDPNATTAAVAGWWAGE